MMNRLGTHVRRKITMQSSATLCYIPAMKFPTITAATLLLVLAIPTATLRAQSAPPQDSARNIAHQVAKVHAATASHAVPFHANWDSLAQYRTPDWFRDAKFGIFLHWGVYSVPAFANEWYSRNMYVPGNPAYEHQIATYGPQTKFGYKDFIPMFRAEHFDPDRLGRSLRHAPAPATLCLSPSTATASPCTPPTSLPGTPPPWDRTATLLANLPRRHVRADCASASPRMSPNTGGGTASAAPSTPMCEVRCLPTRNPSEAQLYGPAARHEPPGPRRRRSARPIPRNPTLAILSAGSRPIRHGSTTGSLGQQSSSISIIPTSSTSTGGSASPPISPHLSSSLPTTTTVPQNGTSNRSSRTKKRPCQPTPRPSTSSAVSSTRFASFPGRPTPPSPSTPGAMSSTMSTAPHNRSSINLIDTVSKNGNLLLNVGPKSDGTIPEEARTVLLQMGAWLKLNGEAIYGTRAIHCFRRRPHQGPRNSTAKNSDIQTYTAQDIRFTTSHDGSILYATALGWPIRWIPAHPHSL